ncbi:hypothetical protein BU26DRAFT_524697 [Trematosphaeria pertusa]|uniref:Uncharacterized protein n=1 Tax=Trematosphaeria pertusa TaxID=390896 RepID=A0A6A6HV46_9PLEO|nr:uncharacterized protein BU26DRAFT_524697 [Trematosphaeria pertusa]KAF2242064.1 hypothetical protein BU26DRAFT_524697 [Trematosphaeria pertusa]
MNSERQKSPSGPGDTKDPTSISADEASHSVHPAPRELRQEYRVFPTDYNNVAEVTEAEAHLKAVSIDREVTQNRRAGDVRSWSVMLSENTADQLRAYHGIREVSPVPPHLRRRDKPIKYGAYAKEPGKNTQAIRDFLTSLVPEEERQFINELEDDAGNILAWGALKLSEDARKEVESHDELDLIEDVVEWS